DALLLDEPLPLPDGVDEELDEEHAPRDRAVATTATPIVVTCCLRRSCISGTPYGFICFLGRDEQAPASRSARKPRYASTVCRRRWYPRANGQWTNGDEKVKFWCPGLRPPALLTPSFGAMWPCFDDPADVCGLPHMHTPSWGRSVVGRP